MRGASRLEVRLKADFTCVRANLRDNSGIAKRVQGRAAFVQYMVFMSNRHY